MIICTQKLWVRPNIPWQLKYPEISADHIEPCSSLVDRHATITNSFDVSYQPPDNGHIDKSGPALIGKKVADTCSFPTTALTFWALQLARRSKARQGSLVSRWRGRRPNCHRAPQGSLPHAYTQPAPCASLSIDTMCLNIAVAAETSCFPTFGWIMRWRILNVLQGN